MRLLILSSRFHHVIHPLDAAGRRPSRRLGALATMAAAALIGGASLAPVAGCASKAQTGALIGAGVGAAGGYIIGNEMDKDDLRDDHRHHHHR